MREGFFLWICPAGQSRLVCRHIAGQDSAQGVNSRPDSCSYSCGALAFVALLCFLVGCPGAGRGDRAPCGDGLPGRAQPGQRLARNHIFGFDLDGRLLSKMGAQAWLCVTTHFVALHELEILSCHCLRGRRVRRLCPKSTVTHSMLGPATWSLACAFRGWSSPRRTRPLRDSWHCWCQARFALVGRFNRRAEFPWLLGWPSWARWVTGISSEETGASTRSIANAARARSHILWWTGASTRCGA